MNDYCEKLKQIKRELPDYAPWSVLDVQALFYKYNVIMRYVITMEKYKNLVWLVGNANYLETQIITVLRSKDGQEDCFNKVVLGIKSDIDSLLKGIAT